MGRFERGNNPIHTMNLGIINKIFASCGKPYEERGAYSFDSYGSDNWMDIIKWLLSQGYTPEETEQVLRSKLMRWAGDQSNAEYGNHSLEDFLSFNFAQERSEVDDFLDQYFPDPKRKNRLKKYIKEDMGGVSAPMATLGNTPGMGNAAPAQQAATTGNQFYQSGSKGSGDNWGGQTKQKKKRKGKKIKLVKESLYEEINS
jgi:hypothetical protein